MIRGCLYAAFALLVWGVTFANTRALLFDFSALEIMVVRFAMAWVALLGMERARRGSRGVRALPSVVRLRWRGEALFAGMGLTGVFVYQFLENCAIYYTNASNVAILVSFGPVVTAFMAKVFCRNVQPTLCKVWVGSGIAIVGVALVSFNNAVVFELRPLGDLMALGAMTSWGIYSVLIDKANGRGVPPLTAIRKAFGWALLMMLPLVVWGGTESGFYALDGSFSINLDWAENVVRFWRMMNWVNLFFLGVLASALAFIAWSKACAALGVVRTTICLYLEPIIGVTFAALFLGERPTVMSACGGAVIIIGVAVANWKGK